MTTAAISAHGTTLTWNSQAVAQLTNIGGVEISVDMLDATNHASTSGFKEFIAGLADAGEVAIEGDFKYDDTNGQIAMAADVVSKTSRTAVITFPTAITATWTFTAFITKLKIGDNPIDGKVPFSASLKITGVPTLATTASNNITALTLTTATLYPTFAQGTYEYVATSTGNTVTFAATFAAGVCKLYKAGVEVETLTTTVASSAQSLGADGAMTEFELRVTETGKKTVTYSIHVANLAA